MSAASMRKAPVLIIVAVLVGGAILYRSFSPAKPQMFLSCDFEEQPGATAVEVRTKNMAVRKLRVEGRIEGTTQRGMFSLDGSATWANADAGKGAAHGNVFLADDGGIDGLFLIVAHPDFTRDGLRIATLNQQGILDTDRATAFLFFDPQEKLSHPAHYGCRVNRH